LKTTLDTLPTYKSLQKVAEVAYKRAEDEILDWNDHELGILTVDMQPISSGVNPHYCAVVKPLQKTYAKALHSEITLVIIPTSIPDSSMSSKGGSAFNSRAILAKAANSLAAQDVIAMSTKPSNSVFDDLPEYLDRFTISKSLRAPAARREMFNALYLQIANIVNIPNNLFLDDNNPNFAVATEAIKDGLRNYSGDGSDLPGNMMIFMLKCKRRDQIEPPANATTSVIDEFAWKLRVRDVKSAANTGVPYILTAGEVSAFMNRKSFAQAPNGRMSLDIQCQKQCGAKGHFPALTWLKLLAIDIQGNPKRVTVLDDVTNEERGLRLEHFRVTEAPLDEDREAPLDED
jgi:hypothetical protein